MMKKAGEVLKEARLQKKLSIEDVCDGTKIRPSYVEALEKSNYGIFHSPTTVKGFLKNYSLYLGLNPDNVIAIYRREQSSKILKEEKKFKFKIPNLQISSSIFVIIFAILIVVSVVGFFTFQYIQVSKPPQFEILEPADGTTTNQDKLVVRVIPEKATDLQINNKSISTVDENGNYFTTVDLIEGANKIIITATNGYKKQSTKEINVYRQKAGEVIGTKDMNIMIKLTTANPISITYKIDDSQEKTETLNPGVSINVVAKNKISLKSVPNINNLVEVIINESKISLLPNTAKQEISLVNNQIKITPLP